MKAPMPEAVPSEVRDRLASLPKTVHRRVELQAEHAPNAVAVIADGQPLTYEQLNIRANQVAHYLKRLGVGPEVPVGICLERSLDMVIAVLGILKAGGAYVPLDPSYPSDRLNFMLTDARVAVLLTTEALKTRLAPHGGRVVCLDRDEHRFADERPENPEPVTAPHHAAYIIYTSGSTGAPKGVIIEHRSLWTYIEAVRALFDLSPSDRVLQFTALSFDVSVEEIFATLVSGATLVLRTDEMVDMPAFLRSCRAWELTVLDLPTAYWHELTGTLVRSGEPLPSSIRLVAVGGEEARVSALRDWVGHVGPAVKLLNLYGPTETTVAATACSLSKNDPDLLSCERLPIGGPIAGALTYVLDDHDRPVTPGMPGELCIGGPCVARGYLRRPGLTGERFVPDPFTRVPGDRMYRTGDMVRRRADGMFEYLGRIDQQVKVRGFRIELGEIERALEGHPAVRESVVQVRENARGEKDLAAYVVAQPGHEPKGRQLRGFLRERLPEYMVPGVFTLLESLPLTAGGKIDQHALPDPERWHEEELVCPRTAVEGTVTEIWTEVLGLPVVNIHTSFLDVGGHSLLATRILSQVRSIFKVDVSLPSFFAAPTVAGLATQIESALRSNRTESLPALHRRSWDAPPPLSYAQERLWFIEQLNPGLSPYNIPLCLQMRGPLKPDVLRQSLAEIVRRHEVLRTTFWARSGEPVQMIAPNQEVFLPLIDLRHVAADMREAEAQRLLVEEAKGPFDLTRGPVFRACLVQIADCEYLLLLVVHHIAADGWSIGILCHEIGTLYTALLQGETPALPQLPIQYADVAAWQREWLQGELPAAQRDYWRDRLAGAPAILHLPLDHARPPVQGFRGKSERFALPDQLRRKLAELGRRQGATLFMTLLAAFEALLHRYGGQDDLVVGAPIAGRTRAEMEALVGFFVNTLALRTDLSGDPSFAELVNRVRAVTLEAYAHQDVPFEQVVEAVRPDRDLSHTPLFQVLFVLQNAPAEELSLPGIAVEELTIDTATAKFDLTLTMEETDQGLSGTLTYNADLFRPETIQRLVGHLVNLLSAVVADPAQRISELPLLSAADRQQLLVEWNADTAPYAEGDCLHHLIQSQAKSTPERVAVVDAHGTLTYRELDQWANHVAASLQSLGVGPEVGVGICLRRTASMVAAVLGVLKAGGAYVPLDPGLPTERLDYMARDAAIRMLVTEESLLPSLPDLQTPVLLLDRERIEARKEPPRAAVTAANLAYVLYTSGSTGRAKGVMIEHQQIVAYVLAITDRFGFVPGTSYAMPQSLAADFCNTVLFPALAGGGTLHLIPEDRTLDGIWLADYMSVNAIDCLKITPSHLAALLSSSTARRLLPRRWLILGGESSAWEWVQGVQALAPECAILIHYGPTETTVGSLTHHAGETDEKGPTSTVPLGRPLPNAEVYLLDSHMQPVPIGVPGEVYLGGSGVSRGYLDRPDLTAERFLPHPFSESPGARLYRTGDLARYRADGSVEFLGRLDHQIKIRGFRIELGEIEAVLRDHPDVRDVVAVARKDAQGSTQVAAYVVPTLPNAFSPGQLRTYLKAQLPEYMIPSALMTLDNLPLLPNGKVNRQRLPDLVPTSGEVDSIHDIARDAMEDLLAGLWSALLGVDRIGIHDNFFELGGHSLLATQLVSRVRDTLGIELPVRSVFEAPTVGALAEIIRDSTGEPAPPIRPVVREGTLPLSFAQEGLWFIDQLEPESPLYNEHAAIRLTGTLDADALERSLTAMVERHEILRTTFSEDEDGTPVQIIGPSPRVHLSITDLTTLPQSEREFAAMGLVRQEIRRPFDLRKGQLLRAGLIRLAGDRHLLILSMHHIASDGWSMRVLERELGALYGAFTAGRPDPLPPPPVQYADFACWQRIWLSGEVLERELTYWRNHLAGPLPVLEVAADYPRSPVPRHRGATCNRHLAPDLFEQLRRLSQESRASLCMSLLAGFFVLLHSYSGQEDLVVGMPLANRTRGELEGVIGFFVNTLPLRIDLTRNPTFRQIVAQVRETLLETYAHQDLPIDQILEEIRPERTIGQHPLFPVVFAFEEASGEPRLHDLVCDRLDLQNGTAKFDLTLFLIEHTDSLEAVIEYDIDLFQQATAVRWIDHLESLLHAAVANPERHLKELVGALELDTGELDQLFAS